MSHMRKPRHEVRDGIHGFITFDNVERDLIDSRPYQRLRSIHQLALTYQLYPGATHRRFEHCLGVMEIATRIFDRLFEGQVSDNVRARLADELQNDKGYWRRVLRAAALLHDLGHLPFSHAAEVELLPKGWDHERLTVEIIRHSEIKDILANASSPIKPEDVIDIAWSPKDRARVESEFKLSPWKALLNEIITGNTFGADRIDYLLRDSWHAGVAYGRFDPDRLVAGLRAIVAPDTDEVAIGLDDGAIHAAEALLLARYFMYTQVYMHEVRRIYDLHLQRFLQAWLPEGMFSVAWQDAIATTDDEVLSAMRKAMADSNDPNHALAQRAMGRQHFRTVYSMAAPHKKKKPTILEEIYSYLCSEFGDGQIERSQYGPKSEANTFWVVLESGDLQRAEEFSSVIANVPSIEIGFVFAAATIKDQAEESVKAKFKNVLSTPKLAIKKK